MADPLRSSSDGAIEVKDDSLAKRYGFKLGASIMSLPISLAQQWLVTRALGPSDYGRFSFLNSFFTEVITFFDSGTSTGFYSKLCARPNEIGLLVFYWRLVLLIAGLLFSSVALVLLSGNGHWFWIAELPQTVFLALGCCFGIWLSTIAGKIADALGKTTAGETTRLISKLAGLAALAGLFNGYHVTIEWFFSIQLASNLLSLFLLEYKLRKCGATLSPRLSLQRVELRRYASEFWSYSHPLLSYSLVGMIAVLADRWLLQRLAGATEQGFYGLAVQVGSFCLIFTSAMIPLLARDFARASHNLDKERISRDFGTHVPRLYAASACLGVFMASEADQVATVLGGDKFTQAGIATALMCLYPIHQTCGQINGSFFYATGQTTLYRNLGLINIALGLTLTVILLGPPQIGGLALGAEGLATKMLLTQFFAVNVQSWIICRQLKRSFWGLMVQQIFVLFALAFLALIARIGGAISSPIVIVQLMTSLLLYSISLVAVVFLSPRVVGLTRADLNNLVSKIAARLGLVHWL